MTLFAVIVLGISVLGIITLFLVKRYELAHNRLVGGRLRERADDFALDVKWVFLVVEWYLARLPAFMSLFGRYVLRTGALLFARVARTSAERAHHIADLASHKHKFERRETKSDYLKQVGEYKNGKSTVASE